MERIADLKGSDIRPLRHRRHISQAKLAGLLDVPQANLSQWELGKAPLPIKFASKISSILGTLDDNDIRALRKKRYQRHHYVPNGDAVARTVHHSEHSLLANREYLSLLERLETQRKIMTPGRPSAIGLFAGCGGLSLGFSWAGFSVQGFVELETEFRRIFRTNFPDVAELGSDIRKLSPEDITKWRESFGEIDVLYGGPPCQGFSLTGKRDRFDPRNQLFREFVRVANILQPKAVLLENVRLLTSMKSAHGNWVTDEIAEALSECGYVVIPKELDSQDYGVPQHRERVFFMAVQKHLKVVPSFPDPTHGVHTNTNLFLPDLSPFRTFRVATCDLEPLESGQKATSDQWHQAVVHPSHVIEWLKDVPEGGTAHNNEDIRLRPPSGYNTTYKRLRWDEPSSTISTTFGMISGSRNVHPTFTRSLTVREALRCQSFPDSYEFAGSLGAVRTSIGNAVPPLLAYALASHLKEILSNQH